MRKIFCLILVLTSLACYSQTKDHYGKYRFDSLYSTLAQKGIDTTNFKIVVERETDGKHFKMYWPTSGGGTTTNALTIGAELSPTGATIFNGSAAKTLAIQAGSVTNSMLAGSIALSKLSITGTPDGTKFLRDDGSWQAAPAPTLQTVTNAGNVTTNGITVTHSFTVNGDNNSAAAKLNTDNFGGTDAGGRVELKTLFSSYWANISPINSLAATHDFKLAANGNGSGTDTLATLADVRGGGGTVAAHGVTVLKNYVTQTTSTGSGTTDNVTIVNIPANSLSANGDGIEIEVAFTTTGSDSKTCDVVIGSSGGLAVSTSVTSAGSWIHKIKLLRTSSTSAIKRSESYLTLTFAGVSQGTTGGFDWTTSQDLKVNITSTTAASITINYVSVKVVKE